MTIGEKIKSLRKYKKITQKQLSELIDKNVRTIQKYESGEIIPPLEMLIEISVVLNVPMEYFVDLDEVKTKYVDKLKDMKEFLQNREGWDLKELIQDMSEKTNLLKCNSFNCDLSIALDECSIIWGTLDGQADFLCGLDDFIDKYTEIFIKNICNLIDSYKNTNY